jgi:hypothetical protein
LDIEKKDDALKNSLPNQVNYLQNDTLDSYAKRWGVQADSKTGDELHRGYDDARIMLEAFLKHCKVLLENI